MKKNNTNHALAVCSRIVTLCVFALVALTAKNAAGQVRATTEEGKVVLLFDDGTWRYEEQEVRPVHAERLPPAVEGVSDCEYTTNETDGFTNEIKRFTKHYYIAKDKTGGRLHFSLRRIGDLTGLVARYSGDLGCFSSSSEILIRMQSGNVITLKHETSAEWSEGEALITMLEEEEMGSLLSDTISGIRLRGTEYYTDFEAFQPGGQRYFVDQYKCIE